MPLSSLEFTYVLPLRVPATLKIFSLIHFISKENLGYFDIIESLTQNLYSQIALLKSLFTLKKYLHIYVYAMIYYMYN